MAALSEKYKRHFTDRPFVLSFLSALGLLAVSFAVNFYAGMYANQQASNPVTDLILDHLPVFNVGSIFIYGPLFLVVTIAVACFLSPHSIPFTLKTIALFVVIRSVFVCLTHIGVFPNHAVISTSNVIDWFSFNSDLFFSGHTGLPFLLALIYWHDLSFRYLFLGFSFLFAVVVLLGHLHYSIDVLAAYFITDSVYDIAERLFKKDFARFTAEHKATKPSVAGL